MNSQHFKLRRRLFVRSKFIPLRFTFPGFLVKKNLKKFRYVLRKIGIKKHKNFKKSNKKVSLMGKHLKRSK